MASEITKHNGGDIKTLIESTAPKIKQVLAKHIDSERFIRLCIFNITRNPALLDCTPLSLLQCVMTAAELGVNLGGSTGEAYPVPFKNSKTGKREAQFILGYKGLNKLVQEADEQIERISAHVVRKGDEFYFELGLDEKLRHVPTADIDAPITHAYAIVTYTNGRKRFEVMSKAEVDRIRKRSRAGDSGPWVTDYDEMAKKTVFRRLAKWLPLTPKAASAIEQSDEAEFGTISPSIDILPADDGEPKRKRVEALAEKIKEKNAQADDAPMTEAEVSAHAAEILPDPGEGSQEPSAHEKIVIALSEKYQVPTDIARARLDRYCRSMFKKTFSAVTEGSLEGIMKHVANDTFSDLGEVAAAC